MFRSVDVAGTTADEEEDRHSYDNGEGESHGNFSKGTSTSSLQSVSTCSVGHITETSRRIGI